MCGQRWTKVKKWLRNVLGNDELHPIIIDRVEDEVAVRGDIWRKPDRNWSKVLDEGRIRFKISVASYIDESRTVEGDLLIPTDELTALLTPDDAMKPASNEGNQGVHGAQGPAGADLGQGEIGDEGETQYERSNTDKGEESKRDAQKRKTEEMHNVWVRLAKESPKSRISDQARYVLKMLPEPKEGEPPKPDVGTIRRVLTERQKKT